MPIIYLTRGLPGSGKSTLAKEWLAEDPENRVRVNRDAIRWTQGIRSGIGTGAQEHIVSIIEKASVQAALKAGKDVIVDATNLNTKFVKQWFRLGQVEFIDLPTSVWDCIERDQQRGLAGGRQVGVKVISGLAKRYGISDDGKLPEPPKPPVPFVFKPAPPRSNLKSDAIIVDIDGTVANHGDRSPYDTSRYHEDTVHEDVREIVNTLALEGYHLIFVSGRSVEFHEVTLKWLTDNRMHPDALFMRAAGDMRNDALVKHDLFHKHIAPLFNVQMVFDDRDRVVEMWRSMGLTVAQVAEGNF